MLQCSHHSWLEMAINAMKWSRYLFKLDVFSSLLPGLLHLVAPCQLRVYLYTQKKNNNKYTAQHPKNFNLTCVSSW